jgi:hypothetical protein
MILLRVVGKFFTFNDKLMIETSRKLSITSDATPNTIGKRQWPMVTQIYAAALLCQVF